MAWFRRSSKVQSKESPLRQRTAKGLPAVLVTQFLLSDAATAASVRFHARSNTYAPVFVTTCRAFRAFRMAGTFAEVFPHPDWPRGSADTFALQTYLRERWRVVLSKWQPDLVVNDGVPLTEYLDRIGMSDDQAMLRSSS